MPRNGYPKLSRQHFAFIAETIAAMPRYSAEARVAQASVAVVFADACAKTNPQFNRERFLIACGTKEGPR